MTEEEKILEKKVDRYVSLIFKRAYRIRKIRRKRKLKEWLNRHVN